jgi:protocatechuate 3,4-dioxygenase, beta subunit
MRIFLLGVVLLAAVVRFSHAEEDRAVLNECEITPAIWQMHSWPEAEKTNNLRRKPGESNIAFGQKIQVKGKIIDSTCAPVTGAIVEIWQADGYGNMSNYKGEQTVEYDTYFRGTGTAITDNLGNYEFITVLPGLLKGRAPFINFRVRHADFLPVETVMFFENQKANEYDSVLTNEVEDRQKDLLVAKGEKYIKNNFEEGVIYRFDITLEGKNRYLNY